MIYPIKVYDSSGKLTKSISSEDASSLYWGDSVMYTRNALRHIEKEQAMVTCTSCGKEFARRSSTSKFCSVKCQGSAHQAYLRRQYREKVLATNDKAKIIDGNVRFKVDCYCGKTAYRKSPKAVHCSILCSRRAHSSKYAMKRKAKMATAKNSQ